VRIRILPLAALIALACTAAAMPPNAHAQEEGSTPGAIPDPSTYQGSMELQRQEQQESEQQQQQNQQMLQRLNDNYKQYAPNGSAPRGAATGGSPPVDWWSKPPLAPANNPLLGRWKQVAAKPISGQQLAGAAPLPGVADAAASLLTGALAGGCNSMFGTGVVAFEPTKLQWVAADGHEEILNNIAYRASGSEVVVLSHDPGAIPALIFGFPSHDHAVVAFFNCTMDRSGLKPAAMASTSAQRASPVTAAKPPVPPATPAAPPSGSATAVLSFQVGVSVQGSFTPIPGIHIWVTPENPQDAMVKAGLLAEGASLGAKFSADCADVATCAKDLQVLTAKALGSVLTDAAGHAQTPTIPAGRYFLVGFAPYNGKVLFWSHEVDLQPGANSVKLDQTNANAIQ
jgi:hypothetical protein